MSMNLSVLYFVCFLFTSPSPGVLLNSLLPVFPRSHSPCVRESGLLESKIRVEEVSYRYTVTVPWMVVT